MTDFEQYKEHIEHTFNAYCKIVIRHTAINVARRRHKQQEREISLDYLTAEKHFPFVTLDNYFLEPERTKEYPCAIEGNTITLNSSLLAAALSRLPERKREMVYLRFFENWSVIINAQSKRQENDKIKKKGGLYHMPKKYTIEFRAEAVKLSQEIGTRATAERIHHGYTGSLRTIYRICQNNNLMIRKKRRANGITKADAAAQKSANLIQQDFTAQMPNEKWLTDITEIPCFDGKLYLATVLDCYDGAIVGYHMDDNMRTALCVKALKNACNTYNAAGMILHSDRGSQFTSTEYRKALKECQAIQSMSGVGRCYDNARMESFII